MLVKIHNSPILCAHVRHRLKPSFVIHADRLRPRVQSRRLAVARPAARCPSRCRCRARSEEHTSELQSLMRISYAVFCLKKKKTTITHVTHKEHSITIKSYSNNLT